MNKALFIILTFVLTLVVLISTTPAPTLQIIQQPIAIVESPKLPKLKKPNPPKTDPLVEAHNKIRQFHNLPPLKQDPELMSYAQKWADHMAATLNMRHQHLGGKAMGENIAEGQKSIDEVMNCWMQSSGHRANILRQNFTIIGVGVAVSRNEIKFWCVDFGTEL